MDRIEAIKTALAGQHLRPAFNGESGWVATILLDGEPTKVWATDAAEGRGWRTFEFPSPAHASRAAYALEVLFAERGAGMLKVTHRVIDVDTSDDEVRATAREHGGIES